MKIELLIFAHWVLTVDCSHNILENHAIAVDQGKIVAILPHKEARRQFQASKSIDLPHHVLMPGLINTHTHAAMSLLKGIADDLPLMQWLQEHIWPTEAQWAKEAFVYEGTQLAIAEMIRSGTTCFNDMYFFADNALPAVTESGIRATLGMIMIDFPTAYASNTQGYLDKAEALMQRIKPMPLVEAALAPHAPYTVSDQPLLQLKQLRQQQGCRLHMHVHETAFEVNEAIKKSGQRPLTRLNDLGLLDENFLAVHMTQLNEAEIQLIAEQQVHVVHCPESNLKLASGFCPVHALQQAGVNVALGTDGNASNNDLDMLGEMRTAALLAKGVSGEATALPAREALRMATINGAKALGIDTTTGSLEIGKAADIIALDFSALEMQPLYDPASHLVYCSSRDQVTHSWVAGRCLMQDRQLMTLDEAQLSANARHWHSRITQKEPA